MGKMKPRDVILKAADGRRIAGLFGSVEAPHGWVLFLHMMPATKESWAGLAERFEKEGWAILAIDLRGHGESEGGPEGYKRFSNEEHQASQQDVEAAVEFLRSEGAELKKIVLVGASIGANLALQYLADNDGAGAAAALSAGLNYYGVSGETAAEKLHSGQRVLLAAARDDGRAGGNAADMAQTLYDRTPADVEKKIIIYERGGHGTDMLAGEELPNLTEAIIVFAREGMEK